MGKPKPLAVPARPADEAPEATPRTIEGGPPVEPDAYGIYHAANTPVGHRGSRGSRAGFSVPSGPSESRAEQLLISQMQTPERHRPGQGNFIVASPLPNLSSPTGLFGASPNPVPLFQPSPKRHQGGLLQSPAPGAAAHHAQRQQSAGYEALFQSPMRGFNSELQAAADLLRFETPSRQPPLDSLISPSPSKHNRARLAGAPNSQGRSGNNSSNNNNRARSVAFDVAGWRHAEEAAGVLGGTEDTDFDLVKNLLQSPGPKEVQQLQQEYQRSKLNRSSSSSPWSLLGGQHGEAGAAAAAAADGSKGAAQVRRRALDFSKADFMHQDLQALPNLRRDRERQGGVAGSSNGVISSSPGADAILSSAAEAAALATAAALRAERAHTSCDLDQQQPDQQRGSKFQPHLPLLPLDLSECERHNPSSTTGLTPKGPGLAAAAAAGGGCSGLNSHQQQQQVDGLIAEPLTSPRTALDAAAAVVANHAMEALINIHSSGQGQQQRQQQQQQPQHQQKADAGGLRPLTAAHMLPSGAGRSSPVRGGMMVPLDNLSVAAAAETDIAQQVLQLMSGGRSQLQHQQQQYTEDAENDVALTPRHRAAAEDGEGGDGVAGHQQHPCGRRSMTAEADEAHTGSGSKRSSARQQARRSTPTPPSEQLQPSRRSRRIASSSASAAAEQQRQRQTSRERTISPAPQSGGGSGGSRGRRTVRRTAAKAAAVGAAAAAAAAELEQDPEQDPEQHGDGDYDAATAMDIDHNHHSIVDADDHQQQQLELQQALEAAAEAAAAAAVAGMDPALQAAQAVDAVEVGVGVGGGSSQQRSRSSSRKGSSGQKSKGTRNQRQQQEEQEEELALEQHQEQLQQHQQLEPTAQELEQAAAAAGAELAVAAAAAAANLAATTGLDAATLAQQAAFLPGLQQLAQLQMLQGFGVTPDKRGAGGMLGPGTPEDARVAHMNLQFGATTRSCHCKKSQCLKLYCDCFANNTYCNGCACKDCKNVEGNAAEVAQRRVVIQQRDPSAFTAKLAQRADTLTNRKGCKCKKSHCLKKYCECYQLGVRCGDLCKCLDCHNVGEIETAGQQMAAPATTATTATSNPLLQQHASLPPLSASSGQQQRMQHAAAAAPFWQLAQGVPGVSTGTTLTPNGTVSLAAQAQAQLLLRLQSGGPGTPGAGLLQQLQQQSTPTASAAAAVAAGGGGGSAAVTPLGSVATTPQPPKSVGSLSADKHHGLRSTAKPLLPEFMQAAEAAAAGGGLSARKMLLCSGGAVAGDVSAGGGVGEEQLPTPDQAGAEQHLLQMRGAVAAEDGGSLASAAGAAAAAAARAEASAAAVAAAAAAHQQFDPAVLAAMPVGVDVQQQQQPGFISSPVTDHCGRQQQQQQGGSPARSGAARATASSSSGGAVPGSVSSKGVVGGGRHRLASISRAHNHSTADEASTEDLQAHAMLMQQHQLQHSGLAALVPGAAAAAADAGQHGGQLSNARRQLLQQIQEGSAAATAGGDMAAGASPWSQAQQQQMLLLMAAATAASGQLGGGGSSGGSPPGQPVMLGPNGPMVVLPQHVLRSAMTQSAAAMDMQANMAAAQAAAAGAAAAAAASAVGGLLEPATSADADGELRQTAGMLMTVVDDQGNTQYYFLPNNCAAPEAAPQQQQAADASAADDPMQVDGASPAAAAATSTQQQQQQSSFATPTKKPPASGDDDQAAAAAAGAGVGGPSLSSCRSTPSKRATPVKRKAEEDEQEGGQGGAAAAAAPCDQQVRPSPAKLPHQLSTPARPTLGQQQQQVSPSQPVVLSPVRLNAAALTSAFNGAAAAGVGLPGMSDVPQGAAQHKQQQLQQQQDGMLSPGGAAGAAGAASGVSGGAESPQEMQMFLATTADGQQLLLRAPAGTDPQSLKGPDGFVQSCYLAAVLPQNLLLSPQQQQQQQHPAAVTPSFMQQQQQQHAQHQLQLPSPPSGTRRPVKHALYVDMPSGQYSMPQQQQQQPQYNMALQPPQQQQQVFASPSKPVMSSPNRSKGQSSPGRALSSPSGMLRFSPGKTVFGPKGTSPSKPLLGSSPGGKP